MTLVFFFRNNDPSELRIGTVPILCPILPRVRKNNKNATKLSQMMMRFKSENMVLQHMNHYKNSFGRRK